MKKLFDNLKKFKNEIAIVDPDRRTYTYNQILSKTNFLNSKIEKKSLILIIASNNIESVIGYISFIKSNNISILLDLSFKNEYIQKIIKKYQPNYIFCPQNYLKQTYKNFHTEIFGNYILIKTDFKKHKKINKENLLLISTSGTTHSPKFVRLSNNNLVNNTKNITKYLKINSTHITITTMPMGYSYGLSIINTHLSSGSKIVITKKSVFDKDFWKIVKKNKITSFGGVPQFYEQLKILKFENLNLPYLKYITQAGGKLENSFLKYYENVCKKKKIKFISMYGQTEASPRMSYLPWNQFAKKLGSIGKALKGSKFKIIDNKGKYIKKPFKTGELLYFGKNVSLGYAYSIKDLEKGDENRGKLFTGDLGYKDKDNFFYITGRKSRMSKIFGIRIDLDNIERELKKNNFIVKCVPDNKYLKILINYNYKVDKIKKIIFDTYLINKNYISILKVKKFTKQNYFKEVGRYT